MRKYKRLLPLMLALVLLGTCMTGCGQQAPEPSPDADVPEVSGTPAPGEAEKQDSPDAGEADATAEKILLTKPEVINSVVYLKGNWHDMGVQYAQQAEELLRYNIELYAGKSVIDEYGGVDGVMEQMADVLANIEKVAPELIELWHGMADGLGVDYAYIVLAGRPATVACNNVSAWGDVTESGTTLCGAVCDAPMTSGMLYQPTIVAYPEGQNAFIASNGFSTSVFAMNEKGVACMASGGQEGLEGDATHDGIGGMGANCVIAARADTAKEAVELYTTGKLSPTKGELFNVADPTIGYVVEHTCNKDVVRTGEENNDGFKVYGSDYAIANNGFITEEMTASNVEFYVDNMVRYWTTEQTLKEANGKATINTIADAICNRGAYIPDNYQQWLDENNATWFIGNDADFVGPGNVYDWDGSTGWLDFDWNPDGVGLFSTQPRVSDWSSINVTLGDLENCRVYLMKGSRDTIVSKIPGSLGVFYELSLCETAEEMTAQSAARAKYLLFLASADVDRAGADGGVRGDYIRSAKEYIFSGIGYTNLAKNAATQDEALMYYGKATTAYGYAQSYSMLATDNPTEINTDYAPHLMG